MSPTGLDSRALASSIGLAIGYGYKTAFGMIARGQQRRV